MLQYITREVALVWAILASNLSYVVGFGAGVGLMLVICALYWWENRQHRARLRKFNQSIRREEERWMSTPEEENLEKVLMSDAICDVIEDLIARGKMRPERGQIWYRRYGNLLNLPDLLPKHELLLKETLRSRIAKLKTAKVIQFPDSKSKPNRLLQRMKHTSRATA